jgi:hypothetical protein
MRRRVLLAGASALLVPLGGCTVLGSRPAPAHWVSVYLGDRDETHEVSVAVENENGSRLFEREYRLSDENEAHEDAAFPETTDPARVVVTVDGRRFERQWPGPGDPQLPCEEPNWTGVEVWVEDGPAGSPRIRIEGDCQHVTMD